MREYDITLKRTLTRLPGNLLAGLTGFAVERWHNVELDVVRERRADLLGETGDGQLVHIELQSTNQSGMARRMLEYAVDIDRRFGRFPEQIVLYVGNAPMRMKKRLVAPWGTFRYRLIDIRELDGEPLLASGRLEDNVIAILMRLSDEREAVRQILARIRVAEPAELGTALEELTILAGLRKLGEVIRREIEQMPILDKLIDHDLLGPILRKGIRQGRKEGKREGKLLGQRLVIGRLIEKRFGPVPEWAKQRIESLSASDLEPVELRLLDARTLEELLGVN
jgi:predicted transposase YdaD